MVSVTTICVEKLRKTLQTEAFILTTVLTHQPSFLNTKDPSFSITKCFNDSVRPCFFLWVTLAYFLL